MGQLAGKLLSWTIKIGFFLAMIMAFVAVINIILLLLNYGLDKTVLADMTSMIQMWLPFNLSSIFWYFTTIINAYIMYRLAFIAYRWISSFLASPF